MNVRHDRPEVLSCARLTGMRPLCWAVGLCVLLMGCKRPPEAPQKLEDLCAFLFEHFDDEDPAELAQGVANLEVWLGRHFEETLEGYEVESLTRSSVRSVSGKSVDLTDLIGVSSAYDITHPFEDVVRILVKHNAANIYSSYETAERTYETGTGCFLQENCDQLDYLQDAEAVYPMNLKVDMTVGGQIRRLAVDDHKAMLQRTWFERAEFSLSWLNVEESYSLVVSLEDGRKTRRLEAIWVITSFGEAPVPEAMAMQLTLDTIQKGGEELQTYLDAL
jgi:hypothetical protein